MGHTVDLGLDNRETLPINKASPLLPFALFISTTTTSQNQAYI